MLLFWRIRYLDSRDRAYKDRDLLLDTDTLDAVTKGAVETAYELRDTGNRRGMLRFRHLFHESQNVTDDLRQLSQHRMGLHSFSLFDYIEDENGTEIDARERGRILTGNKNAVMVPAWAPEYFVAYMSAKKTPIAIKEIILTPEQFKVLAYFVRDLREMVRSTFYKDENVALSGKYPDGMYLESSVTDEEIGSFVTIFRRLYMEKEPGNFLKAVKVYSEALQGHPVADFVAGMGKEYEEKLEQSPENVPHIGSGKIPFTRKFILNVHIYTQYAHQPCPNSEKKYEKCIQAFRNCKPLLTWVFLEEIWEAAIRMHNAGNVIADFFENYCRAHQLNPNIVPSLAADHPGIGQLETTPERQKRILNEKARDIATSLWQEAGQPSGGPEKFIGAARLQLNEALGWKKT